MRPRTNPGAPARNQPVPKNQEPTPTYHCHIAAAGSPEATAPGAYAIVVKNPEGQETLIAGRNARTTIPRMELTALLAALQQAHRRATIFIHSASALLHAACRDIHLATHSFKRTGDADHSDLWHKLRQAIQEQTLVALPTKPRRSRELRKARNIARRQLEYARCDQFSDHTANTRDWTRMPSSGN